LRSSFLVLAIAFAVGSSCVKKKSAVQSVKIDEESGDVSLEWREFIATKNGKSVKIAFQDMFHVATSGFYDKSLELISKFTDESEGTLLLSEGIRCGNPQDEVYVISDPEAFDVSAVEIAARPHESGFTMDNIIVDSNKFLQSGFFKKTTCEHIALSKAAGNINQNHETAANKSGNVTQFQKWTPEIARMKKEGKLEIENADTVISGLPMNVQMVLELALFNETNPEGKFKNWIKSNEGVRIKQRARELVTLGVRNSSWANRLLQRTEEGKFNSFIVPWGMNHFIGMQIKLEQAFQVKGWKIQLSKTVPLEFVNCKLDTQDVETQRRSWPICMSLAFTARDERLEDAKILIVPNVSTTAVLMKESEPILNLNLQGKLTYIGPPITGSCFVNARFDSAGSDSKLEVAQLPPLAIAQVPLNSNEPVAIALNKRMPVAATLPMGPLRTRIFVKCGNSDPLLLSSSETLVLR
jgi:hypothetical protein